jgi:hypothetical protein
MTLTHKALLSVRRWYAARTAQRTVLHLVWQFSAGGTARDPLFPKTGLTQLTHGLG